MTRLSERHGRVLGNEPTERLFERWQDLDFIFLPNTTLGELRPERLDLTINMVSFQEMTDAQVAGSRRACVRPQMPISIRLNRDKSAYNPEISSVRIISGRHGARKSRCCRFVPKMMGDTPSSIDYKHLIGWRRVGVVTQLLTVRGRQLGRRRLGLRGASVPRAVAIVASCVVVAIVIAIPWSPVSRYFSLLLHDGHRHACEAGRGDLHEWNRFPALPLARPGCRSTARTEVVLDGRGMGGRRGVVRVSRSAALAWILTTVLPSTKRSHPLGIVLVTLLLVTAAPVTILTWREWALYYGYLNMDAYSSPTHALLKPLAIVLWFDREGVCRWREPARRPHAERGSGSPRWRS